MGRHARGWTIRRRVAGGVYCVRFTHAGRVVERSTGTRDRVEAEKAAARIYAATLQSSPIRRPTRGAGGALEDLVGKWISSLSATHAATTLKTWEGYAAAQWIERWVVASDLTREAVEAYRDARLRATLATTVRKELTALRSFLLWLEVPVEVPGIPKRVTGTAYASPRRKSAPELSPEQTEKLIAALPAWSTSKKVGRFPIKARFLVGYETSLRPSSLDRLEAPKHYRNGSATLLISPDVDKARYARELPLSKRARRALDEVCPKGHEGAIFGKHDYRPHLEAAATKALPPDVAERFAGTHLRSARITHLLEKTGNLPGVQYLAGHRLASTTALYTKPSLRAAMAVLGLGRPKNSGKRRKRPARKRA
jgi:site-specific recombinase XerC